MQIRPTDFFLEAFSLGLDEDDIKAQVSKKSQGNLCLCERSMWR